MIPIKPVKPEPLEKCDSPSHGSVCTCGLPSLFFLVGLITFGLVSLFLSGCVTRTVYVEKVKYVDIETYKAWGTTRLMPIGVRSLPTEEEICNNPLWEKNCDKHH